MLADGATRTRNTAARSRPAVSCPFSRTARGDRTLAPASATILITVRYSPAEFSRAFRLHNVSTTQVDSRGDELRGTRPNADQL